MSENELNKYAMRMQGKEPGISDIPEEEDPEIEEEEEPLKKGDSDE